MSCYCEISSLGAGYIWQWMNDRMNKSINEWMHEWMNTWIDEWMNACTNEGMDKRMHEWTNEWMNEWMNEWINDRTNEIMNEWINCHTTGKYRGAAQNTPVAQSIIFPEPYIVCYKTFIYINYINIFTFQNPLCINITATWLFKMAAIILGQMSEKWVFTA